MLFEVGETVVYPHHGAATITEEDSHHQGREKDVPQAQCEAG
jgi:RNA polymerase-interacting CarD/CdnL/TRCF family regulator